VSLNQSAIPSHAASAAEIDFLTLHSFSSPASPLMDFRKSGKSPFVLSMEQDLDLLNSQPADTAVGLLVGGFEPGDRSPVADAEDLLGRGFQRRMHTILKDVGLRSEED
jgi:hypothetical protein